MAGILERTIRYEIKRQDGKKRFRRFPWNSVVTSQGGGWEPVSVDHQLTHVGGEDSSLNADYEAEDEILRVDNIMFDGDLSQPYLTEPHAGGKLLLTGGDLVQDRKNAI